AVVARPADGGGRLWVERREEQSRIDGSSSIIPPTVAWRLQNSTHWYTPPSLPRSFEHRVLVLESIVVAVREAFPWLRQPPGNMGVVSDFWRDRPTLVTGATGLV